MPSRRTDTVCLETLPFFDPMGPPLDAIFSDISNVTKVCILARKIIGMYSQTLKDASKIEKWEK